MTTGDDRSRRRGARKGAERAASAHDATGVPDTLAAVSGASTRVERSDFTAGRRALAALACTAPLLAGCDPIWSISGAFFPGWLICMVGGLIAAILVRSVIARFGLEPHIGPRLFVYVMLYLASTCTLWLVFFAR